MGPTLVSYLHGAGVAGKGACKAAAAATAAKAGVPRLAAGAAVVRGAAATIAG